MIIIYIITQILLENESKEKYISYFSESFNNNYQILLETMLFCFENFVSFWFFHNH